MRPALVVGICLCSCSGVRTTPTPRTFEQQLAAADRHERTAQEHDRIAHEAGAATLDPQAYHCGDVVLNEQHTSGTEPLTQWMPCWNADEEATIAEDRAAERERAAARVDRAQAAALARTEVAACASIPERERTHSPLAHRSAIAKILPHREAGRLRGVHIELVPVPGLTADYMRRAISCQQARRSVLGDGGMFEPADPTLVAGADVTVSETGGRIHILVVTMSDADAKVALDRARNLVPQTATR
jgi:hypothetical protein